MKQLLRGNRVKAHEIYTTANSVQQQMLNEIYDEIIGTMRDEFDLWQTDSKHWIESGWDLNDDQISHSDIDELDKEFESRFYNKSRDIMEIAVFEKDSSIYVVSDIDLSDEQHYGFIEDLQHSWQYKYVENDKAVANNYNMNNAYVYHN